MAFWNKKKTEKSPLDRPKPIRIAVASGKGGVGKSTISTNLALSLREYGKVGLLDADIYGPSQSRLLGEITRHAENTADGRLVPAVAQGIEYVSMGLLTDEDAPLIWRAPMVTKMMQQFLHHVVWGDLDFMVIDLPPGTGDTQITLAQQASLAGVIIVTTPQDLALGIAKRGAKMFQQVKVPILGVVENMSGYTCVKCGHEEHLFKRDGAERLAQSLSTRVLGKIPLDPALLQSSDLGLSIFESAPESLGARAFSEFCDSVLDALSGPLASEIVPIQATVDSYGALECRWSDERVSTYPAFQLRTHCRCAHCIDENTGKKILKEDMIPLDIRVKSATPMGRYAFNLQFSDGHGSGIYTFDLLFSLRNQAASELQI